MSIQFDRDLNAYRFFDDRYKVRTLDVIGEDVTKVIVDSSSPADDTTGDPTQWTATVTEAGAGTSTVVNSVTAGELFTITTAANEYDGVNYQLKGEPFKLDLTRKLYFGCKISISDATQSDLFVGIAEIDTTLMATATAHAIALGGDGAFFSKLDGSTTLAAKTYDAGAEASTANYDTALSTDAVWLEIEWDRETVRFYVDDNLVTSVKPNLTTFVGDLTVSFNYRAGEAVAKTGVIHQLRCFQWN